MRTTAIFVNVVSVVMNLSKWPNPVSALFAGACAMCAVWLIVEALSDLR